MTDARQVSGTTHLKHQSDVISAGINSDLAVSLSCIRTKPLNYQNETGFSVLREGLNLLTGSLDVSEH